MLLLFSALFLGKHSRLASLSPTALALKHINPPSSWVDDCSRLLSAVKDGVRESGRQPVKSMAPLGADEVAIYTAVLHQWNSNARTSLNLADRTFPLDATNCECLKGMEIQSLVSASHSFHSLTRDVFPERSIRLINANEQVTTIQNNDPSNWIGRGKSVENAVNDAFTNGLFSMSEIAFDRDHRRALVSYSFVCGSLCGNCGTWLFEKVERVWRRTDRVCGGWVS